MAEKSGLIVPIGAWCPKDGMQDSCNLDESTQAGGESFSRGPFVRFVTGTSSPPSKRPSDHYFTKPGNELALKEAREFARPQPNVLSASLGTGRSRRSIRFLDEGGVHGRTSLFEYRINQVCVLFAMA